MLQGELMQSQLEVDGHAERIREAVRLERELVALRDEKRAALAALRERHGENSERLQVLADAVAGMHEEVVKAERRRANVAAKVAACAAQAAEKAAEVAALQREAEKVDSEEDARAAMAVVRAHQEAKTREKLEERKRRNQEVGK
eukprot:332741-Chlamydomonas_euryale.AAC.1